MEVDPFEALTRREFGLEAGDEQLKITSSRLSWPGSVSLPPAMTHMSLTATTSQPLLTDSGITQRG